MLMPTKIPGLNYVFAKHKPMMGPKDPVTKERAADASLMEKIIHGAPFPFMPFKIRRARPEDFAPRSSLVPQPDPRSDRPPISIENGEIKRLYPAVRAQVVSPHRAMLACLARLDGGNLQQRLLASDFLHVERSLMQAKQAIDEVTSPSLSTYDVKAQRAPEAFRLLYRDFDQIPVLRDVKPESRHRLVIDPCQLRRFEQCARNAGIDVTTSPYAGLIFEQRGYLFGLACGYKLAFEHVDKKLSATLLAVLHAASTSGDPGGIPGGFKGGWGVRRRLGMEITPRALNEYVRLQVELKMQHGAQSLLKITNVSDNTLFLACASAPSGTIKSAASEWIRQYHATVDTIGNGADSESTYLRLLAAMDCLQKCLRLHPFQDGTGRLFQQVALNRELAHLGLPITFMDVPSMFPGVGLDKALDLVIDGMRHAAPHLNPDAPRLETSALNVTPEQRKAYVDRYEAEFRYRHPRLEQPLPPPPSSDSPSLDEAAHLTFDWLRRNGDVDE
jgi:hypothetical protein